MTGSLKLHPIEALLRLCPIAAVQSLLGALLTGEISTLVRLESLSITSVDKYIYLLLSLNITLAFLQNVVSFRTNRAAGALTITVCANMKQVTTIVLGVVALRTRLSLVGGVGMALAVTGSAWYSVSVVDLRMVDCLREKMGRRVLPR